MLNDSVIVSIVLLQNLRKIWTFISIFEDIKKYESKGNCNSLIMAFIG